MRYVALLVFVVLPGVAAVVVSGYYLFQDWASLNAAFARFQKLAMSSAELRSLFIAEAEQNAYRINCFADGVGVLLGALLAAIGIHGLCTMRGEAGRGKEEGKF